MQVRRTKTHETCYFRYRKSEKTQAEDVSPFDSASLLGVASVVVSETVN